MPKRLLLGVPELCLFCRQSPKYYSYGSSSSLSDANGRHLKRPFTAVTISTPPSPKQTSTSSTNGFQSRKLGHEGAKASEAGGQRSSLYPIMPSAAGPRMYENHIPSLMSIYDMDATVIESPGLGPLPKLSSSTAHTTKQSLLRPQPDDQNAQIHSHQHRESTSTQASDSTDSSPTTTISTVDSSSLSDPSPSSSPESPITLVSLSSFSGSSFGLDSFQSLKMDDLSPPQIPIQRPMTSPSPRKTKNLKSLALNLGPSIETLQTSEPSSPSFIKPPTLTGRRKPSLLSLNTGAANGISLNLELPGSPAMPPTMSQRRGLKHSISSPQILSTPSFGPNGGMTLRERKLPLGPSRFKESNLAMKTFTIDEDVHEAPTGVQMATRVPGVAVGGDSFDRPHSGEDAKSPSYPEGPILMHEPSVHLYLEPKVDEAMNFDVIINVAREVKNPFKVAEEKEAAEKSKAQADTPSIAPAVSDIPPDTAMSMLSFQTAFETQPSGSTESSPTTPKPSVDKTLPEYIHVPWDHNTDVKDELWDLCELIDNRTKEGKKVLVHCQQGASRSATLIIAYHMYKNHSLGPNEAYSQAQSKSRWVNPNMSLLFSLNDFKKVIDEKKSDNNNTVRKPTVKHRPTLSADAVEAPPTPTRARGNSTPSVSARDTSLAKTEENNDSPVATHSATTRLGGFDSGFRNMWITNERLQRETNEWEDIKSPRLEEMTDNPIHSFTRHFVPEPEAESEPSLFSPRAFKFPRSSFFPQRTSLAVDDDPRSPPTKGEAPITRSIDDFL